MSRFQGHYCRQWCRDCPFHLARHQEYRYTCVNAMLISCHFKSIQEADDRLLIHRVEMLRRHLYLQWAHRFWDVIGQSFIEYFRLLTQMVGTVIQHCPILLLYWAEYLQVLFLHFVTIPFSNGLWRFLQVTASRQSLVIRAFTRLFVCTVFFLFSLQF